MRTLVVDGKQLAVDALLQTIREIDPDGSHVGLNTTGEAVSYVSTHGVDVAFLNIEMPDMNGLLLAEQLKELHPKINIVFVTNHIEYSFDAHGLFVSGYLTKPASREDIDKVLANLRYPIGEVYDRPHIFVRCFGSFEVFKDGEPIVFNRSKSKELFAYLIDKNGGLCTMGELMGILWEDGKITQSRYSNIRTFIADLRRTFRECGQEDVIKKEYNAIAVRTDRVECDYFNFLRGDRTGSNALMGEYMSQYAWAEMRISDLMER